MPRHRDDKRDDAAGPPRPGARLALAAAIAALAAAWTPERTLTVLDQISATRTHLEGNAAPALALESMLITVASGRTP